MRKLSLLALLLLAGFGISWGQSIFTPYYTIQFTPDYSGDPVAAGTTADSRINAILGDYMGTTSGAAPSGFAGNPALTIPAEPNGVGDEVHGVNPPRAIGVEPNEQIRASNIVARIRGEQNNAPRQNQPKQPTPKSSKK